MMMMIPSNAVVTFLMSTSFTALVSAQSLYNDPPSYFGGQDNDAYLAFLDGAYDYPNSVFLPSMGGEGNQDGAAVHWTIKDDALHVLVAARATGWVGFGISEGGGMPGSDVALFAAAAPHKLVDGHIIDLTGPLEDDCQHWELVNSSTEGGFLIFEAERAVDTFDDQDLLLQNDANTILPPTRVILAWGDSDGVQYHGQNRATGALRFFQEGGASEFVAFEEAMDLKSEGFFDIAASDFEIPAEDTIYQPFCLTWNDIIAAGVPEVDAGGLLTIVGFEPVVDPNARKHVHHFTLLGGPLPRNNDTCEEIVEDTFDLAYAWAPGEPPFDLPDDVGVALGPGGIFQSFYLEIHYDNPTLVKGVLDSSGVRVYYSTTPREHELGMLQIGDPWVNLYGQAVGEGLMEHSFRCGSECSGLILQQPVTALREHLHMHATGVHMYNEQIRDGNVVRTGTVQYFSFDQQGSPAVQQEPFQVLPGDEFKTVCHYKSGTREKWGLSSSEEMCITYISYYPRQVIDGGERGEFPWVCGVGIPVPQCETERSNRTLSSVSDLERTFGVAPDVCRNTVQEDVSDPSPQGETSSATVLGSVDATCAVLLALVVAPIIVLGV